MNAAVIAGSETPLSGWHWVCPCGWSVHDPVGVPFARVNAHRTEHHLQAARIVRENK